jgi:hypothetical protein
VIDQAPWARIDRMDWRLYLEPRYEMPVRGGIRALTSVRCTPGTVCNDRKLGRTCTGWNHQFEARQGAFLADVEEHGGRLAGDPVRLHDVRDGCFGWRVPMLGQTVSLRIPDADSRQLLGTSINAPLCFIDGEAWWWYGAVRSAIAIGNP